ncbi:hypothetical protein ACFXKG_23775 [Streptomyces sp. NPDC059255]|uniref:hypothetical protein n=1 Tax=Streptomyces sp. NPDC059255 TaxID=3346793 RepID=UPI003680E47C
MIGNSLSAELLLDRDVTDAQKDQLVSMLGELGVRADARRALAHRGPAELGWVVLLALPLHSFLSGLGAEAVKDAYTGVKSLLRRGPRDAGAGAGSEEAGGDAGGGEAGGPLVLHDSVSGLRVVLEADLPAEAYRQLVALDLTAYRIGPLHYDRHRGTWRSELDEAAG